MPDPAPISEKMRKALEYYASQEARGTISEGIVAIRWCDYADPLPDGEYAEKGPWTLAQEALKDV